MAVDDALVLDAIFHDYRGNEVLRGAFLRAVRGSVCGIFGANGCGKSTLLKIAAGQVRPSSGLVIIDGRRFTAPMLRQRFEHLAWLPQEAMLPGGMRVGRLIATFPETSHHLLQDFLLRPLIDTRIESLSGGERRYLELRLVLSLGRRYLLLDEPFTGLEPLLIEHISEAILSAARQGTGIIATDHYYRYMLPIIDDAWIMRNGECRRLESDDDMERQLRDVGYLGKR
jgi:lipopolysaccharide export system ATP-binding protein